MQHVCFLVLLFVLSVWILLFLYFFFSCLPLGGRSLEVPDRLPKEMGDGLDQLLIKPSSEVGIVT